MAVAKYSTRARSSRRRQSEPREYVDLEPFRAAFQHQAAHDGLGVAEVARRMGVDRERAAILLGMKGSPRRHTVVLPDGERVTTHTYVTLQRATYDVGVKLCRALDLIPYECGV